MPGNGEPLAAELRLEIGARDVCADGPGGRLGGFIVDPARRAVTHLVVEPGEHPVLGRLVPVEIAEPAADHVALRCTRARLRDFADAEDVEVLPETEPWVAYAADDVFAGSYPAPPAPVEVSENVPAGEVAIRRGDRVHAVDGAAGHVEGLAIGPAARGRITRVIAREGHLWGRRRVAIAGEALERIDADGVHVALTKRDIAELPETGGGGPRA